MIIMLIENMLILPKKFLPMTSENADLCQQSSAYDHNADLEY
jgi:hypothetical protein